MQHLKTISREQPALAQGGDGILTQLTVFLAFFELFVFFRDEVLGKGPIRDPIDT